MPRIGKESFRISNRLVDAEIWYTQKRGFYYKNIPQEVYDLTTFGQRRYKDEGELKTHLLCSLTEYHKKIESRRKVIVYHLHGSMELVMNRREGEFAGYSGIKPGVSGKFDHSICATDYLFGFDFHVLIEVSGRTKEYYHVKDDDTPGGIFRRSPGSYDILMDWTAEREQFFKDLRDKLQQLIYAVSAFFDQPNLLELIDSHGIKMLEASPSGVELVNESEGGAVKVLSSETIKTVSQPQADSRSPRKGMLREGAEKITLSIINGGGEGKSAEWLKENIAWLKNISFYGIELYLKEAELLGYLISEDEDDQIIYMSTKKGKSLIGMLS